ncbi:MAG: NACHT domain-containing protein, partial [Nitrososphaera sp.]|nr:NACHT domain-containing protein [Nitrososphaera sp.]
MLSDYKKLEELYRQYIVDRFSKLTLYSPTSDIPLVVDLERVFVKFTVTQRRMTVRDKFELSLSDDTTVKGTLIGVLSVSESLRKHSCLAVIGAPGSGKTTLLKYVALSSARHQAQERLELDEDRLPVFITLRDFSRFLDNLAQRGELLDLGPHLVSCFLSEHMKAMAPHLQLPDDFFSRQLDTGNCIVLLDGLDEVADPLKRTRVAEAIAAFILYYHRDNRFVITSRPCGYEGEVRQRLSPFCAECTIHDFNDEDMAACIRSWYEAVTRDRLGDNPSAITEAQHHADSLLRVLQAEERLKVLA